MKKYFAILFASLALNANAHMIPQADMKALFKDYHACFILYDLENAKVLSEYNAENQCQTRIPPDSTFKVALSLMAFNEDLIHEDSVFKWDGKIREIPDWNQDLTPKTWIQYSALWVSQIIAPQLGYAKIKHYLASFHYGNQDFSGDPGKQNALSHAWVSSSLKISGKEQLSFLIAMLKEQLLVSKEAIQYTKENMYLGSLQNGASYYGKTGSGRHSNQIAEAVPDQIRDGWFLGFIENKGKHYIFVSNITDKQIQHTDKIYYGGMILKPRVIALLDEYFS